MGINPFVLVPTEDGSVQRIYVCGCVMYFNLDEMEFMLSRLCEGHRKLALAIYGSNHFTEGS